MRLPSVLLSLRGTPGEGDGTRVDGRHAIFTDDYLMRYVIHLLVQPGWWFVFSLLEKSSWLLSAMVALSPGVSGSSAVLLASHPVLLAKIWPLASFGPGVQWSRCTSSYVPIDVASKPYVASLRWDSASSCKLGVRSNVEWWLRSLVAKTTGKSLQGPVCNFLFIQECLCKDVCVILYMNQ